MFNAKKAALNVSEAKENGMTLERGFVLKRIEESSWVGLSTLSLNNPDVKLGPEDYEFFRKLGYIVKEPATRVVVPLGAQEGDTTQFNITEYGTISW